MSEGLWVNPETGEVCDELLTGAVWIPNDLPGEEIDREDNAWLGDWFTQKLVELDGKDGALRIQYEARRRQLKAQRARLFYAWGDQLEQLVKETKGKRKSVDFAYGRCGFRTSTRTEVYEEESAIRWAKIYATAAVRVQERLLKSELPKRGEIPGVRRTTQTVFYAKGS